MIYRKKSDLEVSPIENCMGGQGTVKMEKLLHGPEEMLGKGRAYVRHTLNPGVSIGMHRHEGEMETIPLTGRSSIWKPVISLRHSLGIPMGLPRQAACPWC